MVERSKVWLAYAKRCCDELEAIVLAIRNYIDQHSEQEPPVDPASL